MVTLKKIIYHKQKPVGNIFNHAYTQIAYGKDARIKQCEQPMQLYCSIKHLFYLPQRNLMIQQKLKFIRHKA